MEVFIEISLVIVVAALISAFIRLLRQPLIIAYVITGLIVGPYGFSLITNPATLEVFSQFGVTLLLFIVGLSLSPKVIREVGRASLLTGIGQVLFTCLAGFLIAVFLGFNYVESIYISIALTFSSTIIILKLLADKGDLQKLYGKIAIGFLLVQDIIATLILIAVSTISQDAPLYEMIVFTLWKALVVVLLLLLFVKYALPALTTFFARSQEFLYLFSIAWGMGLATLFYRLGFSLEIGALVAGVSLSLFPYNNEISAKLRPLRDFFLILFFILLGAQLTVGNLQELWISALVFSLFIIIGNPLIVMYLMGYLGYNKRTGFMAGLTVAQISEFSLILVALGARVGHVNDTTVSLVTLVGLITITISSYMILYSEKIYPYIANYISFFEREKVKNPQKRNGNYDVALFGYNRIGYDFLELFREKGMKALVIDFNPEVISALEDKEVPVKYGDAADVEFLADLPLGKAKMVVSTIPDFETSSIMAGYFQKHYPDLIMILIAHNVEDALRLYAQGVHYVILPHYIGGKHTTALIKKYSFDKTKFAKERDTHIKHLKNRVEDASL